MYVNYLDVWVQVGVRFFMCTPLIRVDGVCVSRPPGLASWVGGEYNWGGALSAVKEHPVV